MQNTLSNAQEMSSTEGSSAEHFSNNHRFKNNEPWRGIYDREVSLVVEKRPQPLSEKQSQKILSDAPFCRVAEGSVESILIDFGDLPNILLQDIAQLARRFMTVMQVAIIRVRFEAVTTNACKKLHADYTDLRLITTYAGAGTDYAPHGDGDCCLERLPAGAVGLFKGKLFGKGHTPCLHRSPAIEGTGETRLVLVIDTAEKNKSD